MKVVVVADFCYPNYIGGSARYVYDLVRGFEENKIDFLLITRKQGGEYSLEEQDVFYQRIREQGKVHEVKGLVSYLESISLVGSKDLIMPHHPILGFLFALLFSKKRISYFFHGPLHDEFKARSNSWLGFKVRFFLQSFSLRRAGKIFVLSSFMAKEVLLISSQAKVTVVPAIVDVDKFTVNENKLKLREKFSIPLDKKVLFTSRRLTPRTGVIELADSFIKNFSLDDYHLIIVGQGELSQQLQHLINKSENISFLRFVTDHDLKLLMRLSDVYVLPTRKLEGFGLVVLEALSLKLPVVVSDYSGGAVEFISKYHNDLIFELDNAKSLKRCIESALLIDKTNDPLFNAVIDYDYKTVSNYIYESIYR